MSISTSWYDDEQRVIFQKFDGKWTWEEFTREFKVLNTMAGSVSYNVVLFTDMSHTSIMPSGNILAQGRAVVAQIPDNATQIIFVIQSRLIEVFAGLVFDMIPKWRNRVQFGKTVEEGQKRVAEAVAVNAGHSGTS
jgi:hypothetical protein